MADQTPDPTALDDDQLDNLLDRLAERANERDDLDLPGGGASRRGVLSGLLGLGGAAAGAGVASAIGESESYGNASGVVGTDSEPLNEVNAQNLHAQDAQIDNLLETAQLSSGLVWEDANKNKGTVHTAGDTDRFVSVKIEFDSTNRTAARLVADVNGAPENVVSEVTKDSPDPNDTFTLSGVIPAGVDYEVRDSGGSITVVDWDEAD